MYRILRNRKIPDIVFGVDIESSYCVSMLIAVVGIDSRDRRK